MLPDREDPRRRHRTRRAWAPGCSRSWPRRWRRAGRRAERDRRRPSNAARAGLPPLRRPRDARVPQARRPDQRRAGGHRQRPVGQADHHARGRRRRDRRPAAHPRPARASDCSSCSPRPSRSASAVLHGQAADIEAFADELAARARAAARHDRDQPHRAVGRRRMSVQAHTAPSIARVRGHLSARRHPDRQGRSGVHCGRFESCADAPRAPVRAGVARYAEDHRPR